MAISAPPVVGQAGNYEIHRCYDRTPFVTRALDVLWTMLIPAIESASYGTGNAAFNAFFKSGSETVVRTILNDVKEGTPKQTLWSGKNRKDTPVFFCVREPGKLIFQGVDIYQRCLRGAQGSAPPAIYALGSNFIFICPTHWQMPLDPTYICPTVVNNLFSGYQLGLLNSMPLNLLHELVHFYVDSMASIQQLEVLDWNSAVLQLNAIDSAKNAFSYVYYVASVRAQCKAFPDPKSSTGRRLLAADVSISDVIDAGGGDLIVDGKPFDPATG
ncbi:MAG: hypothetical protein M1836_001238 [Candelina mexicana]|nr:MAG: hypothetical protein M1836_001238 [Candelina mexicana]